MLPRVRQVKPLPEYKLELTFTSGEARVYDCRPLLDFGVFRELRDERYFRQVKPFLGSIAWPHEQDICPDTLYLDSQPLPVSRKPRRGLKASRKSAKSAAWKMAKRKPAL